MRLMVEPQIEAIELEPLHVVISDTTRIIYGKSSALGSTGMRAFSASFPCHTSLRPTHRIIRTSPTLYGGKL